MEKQQFIDLLIQDINRFIVNVQRYETTQNSLTCANCFNNHDDYQHQKDILSQIYAGNFSNTADQGNALETLFKSLFEKIPLIHNVTITNKDIAIGQTDIQLLPVEDEDELYRIWGIRNKKPKSIIGECKNYPNKTIGRPEIEQICWRTCKGSCLSFYLTFNYSQPAIDEIAYFNLNKDDICKKCEGSFIVPINILMIEAVISNNINFCYFIKWAIQLSKNSTSIANYIRSF